MSVSWVALLPPSRGINPGGDGPAWRDTSLADGPAGTVRRRVIAGARKVRVADLGVMVGADSAASGAAALLREIHGAPTMPAVERYAGVVYDHLDVTSMSAPARRRADEHVGIVSALFGFLRGRDPIPPYRLLMCADPPGVGKLHTAWRPVLANEIRAHVDEDGMVLDLLSSEYASAVGTTLKRDRHTVTVKFVQPGGKRVSSYGGKQAKGWLVRHLLDRGAATPDVMADFAHGRLLDVSDGTWAIEING